FQFVRHYHYNDLSQNYTCLDYARNVLATMPQGSILIDNGVDTSAFTVGYLQSVEHERRDVTVIRRGALAGLYNPYFHKFINTWYLEDMMAQDAEIKRLFLHKQLQSEDCIAEGPLRTIIADAITSGR